MEKTAVPTLEEIFFLHTDLLDKAINAFLFPEKRGGRSFAQYVDEDLLSPISEDINIRFGQPMYPRYLAYVVEYHLFRKFGVTR